MSRRQREGRERALEEIARHGRDGASALDIGKAVAVANPKGRRMSIAGKEGLGLAMAVRLMSVKLVAATRSNRFMLAKLSDEAVPPALRREDMPLPGYRRVP